MENKLNYILSCFSNIYKININDFSIHYGIDNISKIQIRKDNIDFFNKREDLDLSKVIWKEWKGVNIPFLFDNIEDNGELPIFDSEHVPTFSGSSTCRDSFGILNYDIIASSFYFLSNWQEINNKNKDNIGRFPYSESIQYKLNIIEIPVVNYYFDILKTVIEKQYNIQLKSDFWGNHDFATFLSHDIDNCQSAWLQGTKSELLNLKPFSAANLVLSKIFNEDKWFNFQEISDLEKELGVNSTFFFLCRKGKNYGFLNADYDILQPKFKKVFKKIKEHNSEIGIHGGFGTNDNIDNFRSDLNKLQTSCSLLPTPYSQTEINGNRFHFLKFDIEKTPEILETNNIKYDSTLGFAEHFGFRNSFCFPFYLYDIKNDKPTNVLEIPLILMDGTLQNKRYLGETSDNLRSNLERLYGLIDEIKKFNGVFSLLWHNTHFSQYKYNGWKKVYIDIIKYCKDENSSFHKGRDIYNIFK